MRVVLSALDRVEHAVRRDFTGESRVLGAARTLLAAAQLSVLLLTPYDAMFVAVGPAEPLSGCGGWLGRLSVYCWAGSTWAVAGLVLALLAVASGLLPRYLSWLHLYCSLSVGAVIDLPDGGDHVVMVVCFWLALASLDDRRTWHWQRSSGSDGTSLLRGVAWAGHWGLRLQIAYVYVHSGLAKLASEAWQEGSATYYVVRMEFFGASGVVGDVAHWLTSLPVVALATTWGTIVLEVALAVMVLLRPALQRAAFALAVLLHVSIVVVLGLFSFGLVMIGSVLAATAMGFEERTRQPSAVPAPVPV